jgi:twitching motility protein PilT
MPDELDEFAEQPRGSCSLPGRPARASRRRSRHCLRTSTTLHEHILTIEDPIEFLHWHGSCTNQRELGPDATSFAEASCSPA